MGVSPKEEKLERLAHAIAPGSVLLRSWSLTGGISAEVTAFELRRASGTVQKLVVRRHGEADRSRNPRIAQDEFKLLRIVRSRGVSAPEPFFVDESGEILGAPCIVVEFIEGSTDLEPLNIGDFLEQAAAELARIHSIGDAPELTFLPRQGAGFGPRPAVLDASLDEERIRAALETAWPLPLVNAPVLLHGDFWPGNWLWRDGRLVGVVDWEDAHIGDPLGDLANSRLELLWAFGSDAMHEFTACYRSLVGLDFGNLPYWDLCAALLPCTKLSGWDLDDATERMMRERHRVFVDHAIGSFSSSAG